VPVHFQCKSIANNIHSLGTSMFVPFTIHTAACNL
jgi:hypothetical protein